MAVVERPHEIRKKLVMNAKAILFRITLIIRTTLHGLLLTFLLSFEARFDFCKDNQSDLWVLIIIAMIITCTAHNHCYDL